MSDQQVFQALTVQKNKKPAWHSQDLKVVFAYNTYSDLEGNPKQGWIWKYDEYDIEDTLWEDTTIYKTRKEALEAAQAWMKAQGQHITFLPLRRSIERIYSHKDLFFTLEGSQGKWQIRIPFYKQTALQEQWRNFCPEPYFSTRQKAIKAFWPWYKSQGHQYLK